MYAHLRAFGCVALISLVFLAGSAASGDSSSAHFISPFSVEDVSSAENFSPGTGPDYSVLSPAVQADDEVGDLTAEMQPSDVDRTRSSDDNVSALNVSLAIESAGFVSLFPSVDDLADELPDGDAGDLYTVLSSGDNVSIGNVSLVAEPGSSVPSTPSGDDLAGRVQVEEQADPGLPFSPEDPLTWGNYYPVPHVIPTKISSPGGPVRWEEGPVPSSQIDSLAPEAVIILNEGNLQGPAGSKYWAITNPGSYLVSLAGSQLVTSNQYAIIIRTSNVILDGNNTLIAHSGTRAGSYGIWAQNGALQNITVRNFRVTDCDYAVELENVASGRLETLTLERNNAGIWVYNSDGTFIEDCHAHDRNNYGIFLVNSVNCVVRNNVIHNNVEGLYVMESDYNQVSSNNASYNDLTGIYLGYESQTDHNLVFDNVARYNDYGILLDRYCDGNSVYGNIAQYNRLGGIMLVRDSGNSVYDNTVTDNSDIGIFLFSNNDHNEIYNNDASRNSYGIVIASNGYYNNVYGNSVTSNINNGIWITENSTFTNLTQNSISSNKYGLMVYDSGNNRVVNNTITSCTASGIYLDRTRGNNEIRRNTVTTNAVGIYLYTSGNERIYDNYFYNTKNVGLAAIGAKSTWNTTLSPGRNIVHGPYLGGNFYGTPGNTGFSQVTPDNDHNGICDTAYSIPTDDLVPTVNIDYLPLHDYPAQTKPGIFRDGFWILDRNGNFQWDGPGNGDVVAGFGIEGDEPVTGDWNHIASIGDKIGIFRAGTWLLDHNGNYLWDAQDKTAALGSAGDIPVVGDWNGDLDKNIGVFRDGFWILDRNGNLIWDGPPADTVAGFGRTGDIPVVADWNGDNRDNIGLFRDGFWILDYDGSFQWEGPPTDTVAGFGKSGDIPAARDWNGDGLPEIGVFRSQTGEWIIDWNRNFVWDGTGPGEDIDTLLGQEGDLAAPGDWNSSGADKIGVFRDGFWILDRNGNLIWDGPPADVVLGFGMDGDIPVPGKYA